MSTATLTPADTNRIPRINETAPDFTAETTQGTIRWRAYSRNLQSATPKLLA